MTMAETERYVLQSTLSLYPTPKERGALRCALGDAAVVLDAMAKDVADEHRVRGRVTKHGQELAVTITLAANAVWTMREKIPVNEEKT